MDKTAILAKLAARMPLFETLPSVARKRIMGTESEYGVQNTVVDETLITANERSAAR